MYRSASREQEEESPTLGEDLKEIVTSFGAAVRESVGNVMSTFGISSLSFEDKEDHSALKDAIRGAFTPLTAFGFRVFVLLYMPCVVVAIAMRQEFGGWKWFGVAFVHQTALVWVAALLVHQGGRLLGLSG